MPIEYIQKEKFKVVLIATPYQVGELLSVNVDLN